MSLSPADSPARPGAAVGPLFRVVRVALYPLLVGQAFVWHLLLTRGLSPSLHALATAGLSLGWLAIFLVLEQTIPYRRDWNENRGDLGADVVLTNLVLPGLSKLNEGAVGAIALWLSAQGLWKPLIPSSWPILTQLGLALLIAEFFYYWTHRLAHKVPFLWRFHAVHHGSLRVYSINAGRFHPVDGWLGTFMYLGPLLLLGFDPAVIALLATLNAITGFLEHANIDFDAGPLNWLFNTAQLHRWHHSDQPEHFDVNHGKVLSVWDQVFGTFYFPAKEVGTVGILESETPVPPGFPGLLTYPWRRRETGGSPT